MAIKIKRREHTRTLINSSHPGVEQNSPDQFKRHILFISDTKYGDIGIFNLRYISLFDGEKHQINYPLSQITTDKIIYSSECFEVADCTSYFDIDDTNILIKSNINIYKKPHKGWNFRLYSNIIFNIKVDGGVEICM